MSLYMLIPPIEVVRSQSRHPNPIVSFSNDEMHALARMAQQKLEHMKATKRRHHFPAYIKFETLETRGMMAEYALAKHYARLRDQWSWDTKFDRDFGIDYVLPNGLNVDVKGTGYMAKDMCCNGIAHRKGESKTDLFVAVRCDVKFAQVELMGWIPAKTFYEHATFVPKNERQTSHYRLPFTDFAHMYNFPCPTNEFMEELKYI